jgi:hypothetical protein
MQVHWFYKHLLGLVTISWERCQSRLAGYGATRECHGNNYGHSFTHIIPHAAVVPTGTYFSPAFDNMLVALHDNM